MSKFLERILELFLGFIFAFFAALSLGGLVSIILTEICK